MNPEECRRAGTGGGGTSVEEASGRLLHPCPFKLRFAPQHELGRSHVSLTKPLSLPATVTGKFHCLEEPVDEEAMRRAECRVRYLYERGPADGAGPSTSAHRYGWWNKEGGVTSENAMRFDRRLNHHIRDSYWLKERLQILAMDNKLKK